MTAKGAADPGSRHVMDGALFAQYLLDDDNLPEFEARGYSSCGTDEYNTRRLEMVDYMPGRALRPPGANAGFHQRDLSAPHRPPCHEGFGTMLLTGNPEFFSDGSCFSSSRTGDDKHIV